jgi:hypothetical protein
MILSRVEWVRVPSEVEGEAPGELTRREDRKAALQQARQFIEARAKEMAAAQQADYQAKQAKRQVQRDAEKKLFTLKNLAAAAQTCGPTPRRLKNRAGGPLQLFHLPLRSSLATRTRRVSRTASTSPSQMAPAI